MAMLIVLQISICHDGGKSVRDRGILSIDSDPCKVELKVNYARG